MRTKLFITGLLVLSFIGCRRKAPDEYKYYQPSTKNTAKAETPDTLGNIATVAKVVHKKPVQEKIKGVDLANDHYFIVVSSYTVEEFALSKKADLIKQGYQPDVFMLNDDGWYKLAVASYKTRAEAENALNKLKGKKGLFSTARIVFKKSK